MHLGAWEFGGLGLGFLWVKGGGCTAFAAAFARLFGFLGMACIFFFALGLGLAWWRHHRNRNIDIDIDMYVGSR